MARIPRYLFPDRGFQVLNGVYAQGFNGKYARWGHVFGDRFWCRSLAADELENTPVST